MAIILIGMLDEREPALQLAMNEIQARGHESILVDISIGNGAITPELEPDITRHQLAIAGRTHMDEILPLQGADRERVTSMMARGLSQHLGTMQHAGQVDGVITVTGMTGMMICLPALKMLPFGLPKVMITPASAIPAYAGRLASFFSVSDITVMHSVVDTVGRNAMVNRLVVNGVGAICGMAESHLSDNTPKPAIAITEFGFCDVAAQLIRERLESAFDMVSFHATGMGERAAFDLIRQGRFEAFIDLVPAGFSEYLLGGNRALGLDRFDAGITMGKPYIIAPSGFDMIGCGPIERRDQEDPLWMKRQLACRQLLIQDAMRVQARTTVEELQIIAQQVADHLNRCKRPELVKFFIPNQGFSSMSRPGAVLHNPLADRAFIETLKQHLDPAIEIVNVDAEINSSVFADAVTEVLRRMMSTVQVSPLSDDRHDD
ncbi:conserved hypothetical protein [Desulfosarcina cetonica]|uniref:Tm-1-like ATP-binding domain-containing protein n=1 Tax=Desulfosarcina cetonica TaxID=90730 RepID=UPI0006D09346|nr:Tm-1-like ATP-binding domain-containing protein [Desulfosarcina cetonica]VTR65666.1 conserved hypothetical protein [Desulfosarcina cetonica]